MPMQMFIKQMQCSEVSRCKYICGTVGTYVTRGDLGLCSPRKNNLVFRFYKVIPEAILDQTRLSQ
jgi:hypothetical protein